MSQPPFPSRPRSGGRPLRADVVVVAGVHAAQRHAQAARLAADAGATLVAAVAWGEDGLVPEAVLRTGGPVVLEVPAQVPVTHVIGELADEPERVRVTAVVAVACLHTLHEDLADGAGHGRALVDCLEAATHHALVGASEPDRATGPAATPGADRTVHGVLRADGEAETAARRLLAVLRPDALPVVGGRADAGPLGTAGPDAAGGIGPELDCAGWLQVVNGEWPTDRVVPGVGVARYERHRPFHRGRLEELADRWALEAAARGAGGAAAGLRISGLCRLGDLPEWTFRWDQVGTDLELHPLAPDDAVLGAEPGDGLEPELLCVGPELALFGWGAHADLSRIVADLDAALLTDAEFAAGPDVWG
ncbi:hypothetical protein [Micrococcus lylae]|uniref:hypothetical protein n=1 Tax=Micrococcus lylae TaxID=1273 RepID=UPI000B34CC1A|nr:hypothetical protein [Micrococcus lylae]